MGAGNRLGLVARDSKAHERPERDRLERDVDEPQLALVAELGPVAHREDRHGLGCVLEPGPDQRQGKGSGRHHGAPRLDLVGTGLENAPGPVPILAMGYSAYRREKALALANQADAFERQQAEIERLQRFVDKFRAGTRSRQAQSKAKAIQRMPKVEAPRRDRAIAFGFSKVERSGRIVVEAENARAARRRQAAARRRRDPSSSAGSAWP